MIAPEQIPEPAAIEAQAAEEGAYVFHDEAVLGTRLQIQLVARNFAAAKSAALAARTEIDRLNLIFNSRNPSSELYRLNRQRERAVSPELFAVIDLAERWRTETGGAYSGRLGLVIDAWRKADRAAPSRAMLANLARDAAVAKVVLHSVSRIVVRPDSVQFAFDAIAKGWIVDRAFDVAMQSADVSGALVDIGGEIRCGGSAPNSNWCVGVNDPLLPFDNAPLVAEANLSLQGFGAIATSGRGPRDRVIDGTRYSATLSPFDGWPVKHHVSVTTLASSAADADALATAMMVLPTEQAIDLANRHAIPARITVDDRTVKWTRLAQPNSSNAIFVSVANTPDSQSSFGDWQPGWQALATFTAPRRQLIRDPDFRSPYMAMWITDEANKPIRTLILIGKQIDWQKDNYIWWSINRAKTDKLVATRSMSTSGAGVYNVFWDGVDDVGKTVPAGKYVLHVETSRERGKHTYRSLELNFEKFARFVNVLPPTEEGGGLRVSFDHY